MEPENCVGLDNVTEKQPLKPEFYIIVHNVAKRQNVGNMLRSACAFGVAEVIFVGSKKNLQLFGSQGTHKHVKIRTVDSLEEAVSYVKAAGCKICGVEIRNDALNIVSRPFEGNTAFILGNEGHGLTQKQADVCDFFVYIPHYGNGTASLNVTVAASIIFHHFAEWAGYVERPREGEKYVVDAPPQKRGISDAEDRRIHALREQRRNADQMSTGNETLENQDLGSMFD
mmetsp:Transcript_1454/g.1733  ORF Transcript_1454/g.1733 Transcript_1454/m.1733 type:complete len:228 (+) Transcript_1454:324-1007(+)|eukprot:CAMPEP_0184008926 /NCGR_PEP_ID=MMETSP0954-20121128/2282_1 /TAXON_ID=627963 /ORGANISM="Aplanochytrium sp, Strain PBS07" /LENGTH=227 /DNA_ID=CAMNT_0026288165 /DNA_START=550 /DNA_END=1233 /DNA_ORIENTATION=-